MRLWLLLFALLLANCVVYSLLFPPDSIVVRQSEGVPLVLLRTGGRSILINVGASSEALRLVGESLPSLDRSLDFVVLTSPKESVAGALPLITKRYRVGQVLWASDLMVGEVSLHLRSPDHLLLESKNTSLLVSSTTPPGTYRL